MTSKEYSLMPDRFSLLPDELQRYIHSLVLKPILTYHYFKWLDRMRIAISLLHDIVGRNLEGKPGYFIVFPVDEDAEGYYIFDLNNPYLLRVLSYAAKVFDTRFSKYFDVDNAWWYSLVIKLNDNVTKTYDDFGYHYLSQHNFILSHAQFLQNLKLVRSITSRIADKLVLHYPMGFPWEHETDHPI